jgi:hypothetical protein
MSTERSQTGQGSTSFLDEELDKDFIEGLFVIAEACGAKNERPWVLKSIQPNGGNKHRVVETWEKVVRLEMGGGYAVLVAKVDMCKGVSLAIEDRRPGCSIFSDDIFYNPPSRGRYPFSRVQIVGARQA